MEELIVQIDPFADIFNLRNGQSIKIGAYLENGEDVIFEIDRAAHFICVCLLNNSEYFLLVDSKELKPHEYYSSNNT